MFLYFIPCRPSTRSVETHEMKPTSMKSVARSRMARLRPRLLLLFFVLAACDGLAQTAAKAPSGLPEFATLAEKVGPAVVNISTTQPTKEAQPPPGRQQSPFGGENAPGDPWRRFDGPPGAPAPGPFRQQGLASGFIIDRDGTILTNNHVVDNAEKIVVRLSNDDRQFVAKVVGKDARTDLAVIRIDANGDLPVLPLGDSDQLRVGEWVVALGSPFGLQNSITAGIVSAKSRQIGAGAYDDFIQTDASINPGNSGGPLINMKGEVVGINSAILSRSGGNLGIGFAIPVNLVKDLLPELRAKGKVTRGWLGVSVQKITPEIAESLGLEKARGALIAAVMPGSPAERAGLRTGDVIVEYAGKPIADSSELPLVVARTAIGTRTEVKVLRDEKEISFPVAIMELKEEEVLAAAPQKESAFGVTVQNLTPEIGQTLGIEKMQGVVITAVVSGSPAEDAGLRRGDVILQIDRKSIRNVADYKNVMGTLKAGESTLFLVQRGPTTSFVAFKIPSSDSAPS
jgi:serine protease Do